MASASLRLNESRRRLPTTTAIWYWLMMYPCHSEDTDPGQPGWSWSIQIWLRASSAARNQSDTRAASRTAALKCRQRRSSHQRFAWIRPGRIRERRNRVKASRLSLRMARTSFVLAAQDMSTIPSATPDLRHALRNVLVLTEASRLRRRKRHLISLKIFMTRRFSTDVTIRHGILSRYFRMLSAFSLNDSLAPSSLSPTFSAD